jgi:hypothetical protein
MSENAVVLKDPENQIKIPSIWRGKLSEIVNAFKDGDFELSTPIVNVPKLPEDRAKAIQKNIENYGAKLISLPNDSWDTSVCQWMEGYWDILVDLFTEEEGASDLALWVRVTEANGDFTFNVLSVYVP